MADDRTRTDLPRVTPIQSAARGFIALPTPPVAPVVRDNTAPYGPCPPDKFWLPALPRRRDFLPYDLTGFYEPAVREGARAWMMVQLCSAGRAIVGWLSPIGRSDEAPQLKSWPMPVVEPRKPNRPGIFIVDTTKGSPDKGWMMYWDLAQAPGQNTRDPHEILDSASDEQGSKFTAGYFLAKGPNHIILRFDGAAKDGDSFFRYRPSARIPWTIGETLPTAAKSIYISQHVQPFPPTEKWLIADRLRGGIADSLLKRWYETPSDNGAARRVRRLAIADFLNIWLLQKGALDPGLQDEIRGAINLELGDRRNLDNILLLGDTYRTYVEWYRLVAAEERDNSRDAEKSFEMLGFTAERDRGYAYIVRFQKARASDKVIIGFGVAGFLASIRKVEVTFVTDRDGVWKRDNENVPTVTDPSVLADESKGMKFGGLSNPLIGVFADIGLGIGFEIDTGLSRADADPSAKSKVTGGDVLGSVTFYSNASLDYDDFAEATFKITAVKGPAAKFGNFVSGNLFSTIYHNWTTRHGIVLDAIETKYHEVNPPEVPKWTLILKGWKGIKEYVEGWYSGKISGSLFEVSTGWGFMVGGSSGPSSETPSAKTRRAGATAKSSHTVWFERDTPYFNANPDALQDGRFIFECWLAQTRVLLTERRPRIDIAGFTSPEASRCYNQILSQARAETVSTAFLDGYAGAFGSAVITVKGWGELPALKVLSDPPEDSFGRAKFEHDYPHQVSQWPEWRRVEVRVDGSLAFVGYAAVEGQKSTN